MVNSIRDRLTGGINEAFPHKICINLDRRQDRWQQMSLKFDRHGIDSVRRFSALEGDRLAIPLGWNHTSGAYGCLQSHVQVAEEARRLGLPSLLIFEDDAVFDSDLKKKFSNWIEQLPPDWDMLFFGALHKDEPIRISENMARLTRSNSTYAYAMRERVFDPFIELNRRAETVLDNNSFILQQRFNCYCFMPHLAWVENDYSDAQNRLENHWYLEHSLVLFGAEVDRLLSDTTVVFAHGDLSKGATENLVYLVNYYHDYFSPYIEIVIVEQGGTSTLDQAALPQGCRHLFLQHEGSFDRRRCFETGIGNSNRKFVILSDADIYLETLDIRGNLRMCEQYDCAMGFSRIIDLTRGETDRLRETMITRGIDLTKRALEPGNERDGYCLFGKREGLTISGRRLEGVLAASQAKTESRVFQSPNHALRLLS